MKHTAVLAAILPLLVATSACDPTDIKGTVTRDDMVWSGKAAWQYVITVRTSNGDDTTFHTSRATYQHCPVGSAWPTCR